MRARECLLNDEANDVYRFVAKKGGSQKRAVDAMETRLPQDSRLSFSLLSKTKFAGDQIASRREADCHRRIEMAPRDVSNCIGHCQHGEPEGERNTEQADADLGKGSGNDNGAATAQGQPERADQLGDIFRAISLLMRKSLCGA